MAGRNTKFKMKNTSLMSVGFPIEDVRYGDDMADNFNHFSESQRTWKLFVHNKLLTLVNVESTPEEAHNEVLDAIQSYNDIKMEEDQYSLLASALIQKEMLVWTNDTNFKEHKELVDDINLLLTSASHTVDPADMYAHRQNELPESDASNDEQAERSYNELAVMDAISENILSLRIDTPAGYFIKDFTEYLQGEYDYSHNPDYNPSQARVINAKSTKPKKAKVAAKPAVQ